MATTVSRLRIGTAGTSDSSPYTVAASTTAIITNIILSNKTANTRYVTITFAGYSFCTSLQVPGNGTVNFDARSVLNTTETLTIVADAAAAVDFIVSGVLVS